MKNYISLRQISKLCKVSKQAILDAVNSGKVKGFRIDHFWVFKRGEVSKYLKIKRAYNKRRNKDDQK